MSIEGDLSEAVVLAWKKNLTEIFGRQSTILIRVKEPEDSEAFVLTD
jgi:hypothetical protein